MPSPSLLRECQSQLAVHSIERQDTSSFGYPTTCDLKGTPPEADYSKPRISCLERLRNSNISATTSSRLPEKASRTPLQNKIRGVDTTMITIANGKTTDRNDIISTVEDKSKIQRPLATQVVMNNRQVGFAQSGSLNLHTFIRKTVGKSVFPGQHYRSYLRSSSTKARAARPRRRVRAGNFSAGASSSSSSSLMTALS
jgi:hypothetical protein